MLEQELIYKNIAALLPELLIVAKRAGAKIMAIYASDDFGTISKKDDSPLTLADMAAHQAIVAGLTKLTTDIPILSEESSDIPYAERSKWSRYWLVDPLDGTKEFIKRNGEFTVNIALVENGKPVMGVVYAPFLDVCYYGVTGEGAFMQQGHSSAQKIVAKAVEEGATIKVVASRSHCDLQTQGLLDMLGKYECINMGSSLKLCLVAEGAAHFYPRLGPTMEWDTAAAHAVVNAAGGVVQDRNGKELEYNKPDLHNSEFFVLAKTDKTLHKIIRN